MAHILIQRAFQAFTIGFRTHQRKLEEAAHTVGSAQSPKSYWKG